MRANATRSKGTVRGIAAALAFRFINPNAA